MIEHDGDVGALGVVLNRPSDTEVVEHPPELRAPGPVARRSCRWPAAVGGACTSGGVVWQRERPHWPGGPPGISAPIDMEALLDGRVDGIDAARLFTGYFRWAAGQPDAEISRGVVTALPDDAAVIPVRVAFG